MFFQSVDQPINLRLEANDLPIHTVGAVETTASELMKTPAEKNSLIKKWVLLGVLVAAGCWLYEQCGFAKSSKYKSYRRK